MTTCQTINGPTMSVLLSLATNVVSTPPGVRTWLAPRSQTFVYKVGNIFDTSQEQILYDYKRRQINMNTIIETRVT